MRTPFESIISSGRTVGCGVAVNVGVFVGGASVGVGAGVSVGGTGVSVARGGISVGGVSGTNEVTVGQAMGVSLAPHPLKNKAESVTLMIIRKIIWRLCCILLERFSFFRIVPDLYLQVTGYIG
jgi:hypothetical protein